MKHLRFWFCAFFSTVPAILALLTVIAGSVLVTQVLYAAPFSDPVKHSCFAYFLFMLFFSTGPIIEAVCFLTDAVFYWGCHRDNE